MGIGPVPAIRAMLKATGLELSDVDIFDVSGAGAVCVRACGCVVCVCLRG